MSGLTLYSMPSSGNSYKARLLLSLLGRDYTHVPCEADTPALQQAKSEGHAPLGKLPVLELPDGTHLPESNAILWFLARGTAFLPEDPLAEAQILAWMFFEQNRHEPVIAVRSALRSYPHRAAEATAERMESLLQDGHTILQLLDDALADTPWLAGESCSIADIALYAYTHTAGSRGGFDMDRFPHVTAWCARIAALPGYEPLDPSQQGA